MAAGCGSRFFSAIGAGLCFLVVTICCAGIGKFVLDLVEAPPPWDWLLLAQFAVMVGIFGGGVAFLHMGLSMIEDLLPRERPAARPLRHLVVLAIVLALALLAIPMFPVGAIAMIILRVFGPPLSWVMTRHCADCGSVRSERPADAGPVFCPRHHRFFGDDMYRGLVSPD